jgi:hypothetical protein
VLKQRGREPIVLTVVMAGAAVEVKAVNTDLANLDARSERADR